MAPRDSRIIENMTVETVESDLKVRLVVTSDRRCKVERRDRQYMY